MGSSQCTQAIRDLETRCGIVPTQCGVIVAEVKVQMILKLFPFVLSESLFPLISPINCRHWSYFGRSDREKKAKRKEKEKQKKKEKK